MAGKKIFVSFHYSDSAASYGRITEHLIMYFGADALLQRDSSAAGAELAAPPSDYSATLDATMQECGILALIIGPDWVEQMTSRTGGADSIARMEIEAALRRGIPIIPILVQGATMPAPERLPPSLRLLMEQGSANRRASARDSLLELVARKGLLIRQDPDFRGDALRLCEVIEGIAGILPADPQRVVRYTRNTTLTIIAIGVAILALHAVALAGLAEAWVISPNAAHSQALDTQFWVVAGSWAPLLDFVVLIAASYFTGRRTGELASAVTAAIVIDFGAILSGILAFGAVTWANWPELAPFRNGLGGTTFANDNFGWLLAIFAASVVLGVLATPVLGLVGGLFGTNTFAVRKSRLEAAQRAAHLGSLTSTQPGMKRQMRSRRGYSLGKVFISYRRADSALMCGAIYERLTEFFGVNQVFKDIDMIPYGANFQTYIDDSLRQSRVQLVLIGPGWLDIRDVAGRRRLDDPGDFVRLEIESALRLGLMVIPVLVQGATLPSPDDLPESLRPLVSRGPLIVRFSPHFDADMRYLADGAWPAMQIPPAPKKRFLRLRKPNLRALGSRAARSFVPLLFAFALCGLALGLALARAERENIFPFDDPVIFRVILSGSFALLLLSIGTSALFTKRARKVIHGLGLSIIGIFIAFLTGTTVVITLGWSIPKAGIDNTQFANLVVLLAFMMFVAVIILLFPFIYISARLATFIRRRRTLLVASAMGGSDANQALAGLRDRFGRQVVPISLLLAKSRGAPQAVVRRAVSRCAGVIALLGSDWNAPGGHEREHMELLVEAALDVRKPIIPVLLTGATIPSYDQLSATAQRLTMLNAASLRRAPDFPNDMRRLNTVIERATQAHQARRLTPSALMALGGGAVALAAIILGGMYFDIHFVLSTQQNDQTTPLITQATLTAVSWVIYLLAGATITGVTGRIRNGLRSAAVIAFVGNAVATVYLGILLAHNGAPVATITASTAQTNLEQFGFLYGAYLVIAGTLSGAFLGWMGAFIGRAIYQERQRSAQNRILVQAIQRETPASQGSATLASHTATPTPDAATTDEAARRAEIEADRARARQLARGRQIQRNWVISGAALVLAIAVVAFGALVYKSQLNTYTGLENTIGRRATATAAVGATATARALIPYAAHLPGPHCDKGAAQWFIQGRDTCESSAVAVYAATGQQHLTTVEMTWPKHVFMANYSLSITVTSLHGPVCAGLFSQGQLVGLGGIGVEICPNHTWNVYEFDSAGSATRLAHGDWRPASANRIQSIVDGSQLTFSINGVTQWTGRANTDSMTSMVGYYVDPESMGAGEVTVRDFKYAPIR